MAAAPLGPGYSAQTVIYEAGRLVRVIARLVRVMNQLTALATVQTSILSPLMMSYSRLAISAIRRLKLTSFIVMCTRSLMPPITAAETAEEQSARQAKLDSDEVDVAIAFFDYMGKRGPFASWQKIRNTFMKAHVRV